MQHIIDIPTWEQAGWQGAVYAWSDTTYPFMALLFREEGPARKIFNDWFRLFGDIDDEDRIRVSIIEGDVPGEDPGYFIHLSPSHAFATAHSKLDPKHVVKVSRIHRMNPPPDSQNLANFKAAYQQHGRYDLKLATLKPSGQLFMHEDLRIEKREIHFRHVSDIGDPDEDRAIFNRIQ